MQILIPHFQRESIKQKAENKKFLTQIKKINPRKLDDTIHAIHDSVFEKTDCLSCANCCKTTSPIFTQKDIERIAKHLKISAKQFIEKYLRVDEDQDYVLKLSPCVFLNADHTCSIYSQRPVACKEYPHTNRKRFYQITELTYRNTLVCPAVLEIIRQLKSKFPTY